MAQINVADLTFCYEGSFDNIFESVSFSVDTDWKLGLIGRNGKGKTTFLNLLLGKYEYSGTIRTSTVFDYFPYQISAAQKNLPCADFLEELKPGCELWRVICELDKLGVDEETLFRPFGTLSHGERTKVMLAVLFSGENEFLLIDEPTNHLDGDARETVKEYLRKKKGFLLVSHDRDLLDACVDHVLVLNRSSIEVQAGNFSSWWENKSRRDAFVQTENEKHKKEIAKLRAAARQTRQWADKNEGMKIGFDPAKEPDRCISTRAYIGAKTKKMQSRVGQIERRIEREIEEKEGLLSDIESPVDLKIMPLTHHKEVLVSARGYGIRYPDAGKPVFRDFDLELRQGERVFLHGKNGCGKSSLIKAVERRAAPGNEAAGGAKETAERYGASGGANGTVERYGASGGAKETAERYGASGGANGTAKLYDASGGYMEEGTLETASGLVISCVNQDTSFLTGSIRHFCEERELDESLFGAILRQLDMERVQFAKSMEDFSEGQKKKVLIAASLLTPAHLYVWDEPLNYIDVFSRMQIERLILAYQPTMLIVEHDARFREKIATRVVGFQG